MMLRWRHSSESPPSEALARCDVGRCCLEIIHYGRSCAADCECRPGVGNCWVYGQRVLVQHARRS